jgi:integrase
MPIEKIHITGKPYLKIFLKNSKRDVDAGADLYWKEEYLGSKESSNRPPWDNRMDEARKLLDQMKKDKKKLKNKGVFASKDLTVIELIEECRKWKFDTDEIKIRRSEQYISYVNKWIKPKIGDIKADKYNTNWHQKLVDHVKEYIYDSKTKKQVKRTKNKDSKRNAEILDGIIRASFRWGMGQGKISFNPLENYKTTGLKTKSENAQQAEKKERIFLEDHEVIEIAKELENTLFKRITILSARLGTRANESIGLQWRDFDCWFNQSTNEWEGTMDINRQIYKNEVMPPKWDSYGTLDILDADVRLLKEWSEIQKLQFLEIGKRVTNNTWIFTRPDGDHFRITSWRQAFQRASERASRKAKEKAEKAKTDEERKKIKQIRIVTSVQLLRHYHASTIITDPANRSLGMTVFQIAQKRLRHKNLNTTIKNYIHLRPDLTKSAVQTASKHLPNV